MEALFINSRSPRNPGRPVVAPRNYRRRVDLQFSSRRPSKPNGRSPDARLSKHRTDHDPLHGYIAFTSGAAGETSERDVIDHPWVQRLRQIHQLQTAWWVFPTAEHTRFQHVLGVMHIASRAAAALYESLAEVCPDVPSQPYVESLLRMAGLLHDVGHGPFGHFFDDHFLARFGQTHETIGAQIICAELGSLLRGIRRTPNGRLRDDEQLDPAQIAYVITRPTDRDPAALSAAPPRWLRFLRSLFCGLYTVDNMDFVLRDAYMSGYSLRAFDLDRLLHYSYFSESGLTIHERGVPALARFVAARAELFRAVYFHRTVRAIDLTLADLFADSGDFLFPGDPLDHLDEYRRFTEWSLLVDVARWADRPEVAVRLAGRAVARSAGPQIALEDGLRADACFSIRPWPSRAAFSAGLSSLRARCAMRCQPPREKSRCASIWPAT